MAEVELKNNCLSMNEYSDGVGCEGEINNESGKEIGKEHGGQNGGEIGEEDGGQDGEKDGGQDGGENGIDGMLQEKCSDRWTSLDIRLRRVEAIVGIAVGLLFACRGLFGSCCSDNGLFD